MGKHRNNPDRPEPDYDVGYCIPPQKGKFKPGQSGNPKGRPRKRASLAEDRENILQEVITVKVGSRERKLTRQNAILRTMSTLAIKGEVRAARFMLDLGARAGPNNAPPEPDRGSLSARDHAVLADYMRRTDGIDIDRNGEAGLFGEGGPPAQGGQANLTEASEGLPDE